MRNRTLYLCIVLLILAATGCGKGAESVLPMGRQAAPDIAQILSHAEDVTLGEAPSPFPFASELAQEPPESDTLGIMRYLLFGSRESAWNGKFAAAINGHLYLVRDFWDQALAEGFSEAQIEARLGISRCDLAVERYKIRTVYVKYMDLGDGSVAKEFDRMVTHCGIDIANARDLEWKSVDLSTVLERHAGRLSMLERAKRRDDRASRAALYRWLSRSWYELAFEYDALEEAEQRFGSRCAFIFEARDFMIGRPGASDINYWASQCEFIGQGTSEAPPFAPAPEPATAAPASTPTEPQIAAEASIMQSLLDLFRISYMTGEPTFRQIEDDSRASGCWLMDDMFSPYATMESAAHPLYTIRTATRDGETFLRVRIRVLDESGDRLRLEQCDTSQEPIPAEEAFYDRLRDQKAPPDRMATASRWVPDILMLINDGQAQDDWADVIPDTCSPFTKQLTADPSYYLGQWADPGQWLPTTHLLLSTQTGELVEVEVVANHGLALMGCRSWPAPAPEFKRLPSH